MRNRSPTLERTIPATSSGSDVASPSVVSRPTRATILSIGQTLLEHHARPPAQPLALALVLELAGGGQDVAALRRAHRPCVAVVLGDVDAPISAPLSRACAGAI